MIVGLFLPSTAEILDSPFLFVLFGLNDFLHNYDFVMIIMQDFSTTKELLKHYFTLISKG